MHVHLQVWMSCYNIMIIAKIKYVDIPLSAWIWVHPTLHCITSPPTSWHKLTFLSVWTRRAVQHQSNEQSIAKLSITSTDATNIISQQEKWLWRNLNTTVTANGDCRRWLQLWSCSNMWPIRRQKMILKNSTDTEDYEILLHSVHCDACWECEGANMFRTINGVWCMLGVWRCQFVSYYKWGVMHAGSVKVPICFVL